METSAGFTVDFKVECYSGAPTTS